jgi:urea transport system permease protein
MGSKLRLVAHLVLALVLTALAAASQALTQDEARSIAEGENDARIAALDAAVAAGDARLPVFLQALLADEVKLGPKHVLIVPGGDTAKAVDAVTGASAPVPDDAQDVVSNNRVRRAYEAALAALKLFSPDQALRAAAITELKDQVDASKLPLVEKALASESNPDLRSRLELLRAAVQVSSGNREQRLSAARAMAGSDQSATRALLLERLAAGGEADPAVRAELQRALGAVEARLAWGERLGVAFTGISLGSILLLAALGLAITYGLMGVINMAHGELIMIGAYAAYLTQNAFKAWLPSLFDWYVLAAIPASFAAAALVGALMERSVIRWLYGRPLETLLATWGLSLILMQAVRSVFGAQNVPVENPSWLSGGVQVMSNLTLPWNRVAIIAFAVLVLAALALVIARTRLGLFVRGVTQNRPMAACVGVDTAKVDTWAFALGSGIAGLAGCALAQVGTVGPDLGQAYIVDSFMVVVLGGVGQLAGTVYAALGLGVINKLLEGWAGAVLAKIMVLVLIVVFIQKRPQGLFAMKGRSAEA